MSGTRLSEPPAGRIDGWYLQPDGVVTAGWRLDLPVLTLTWETAGIAVETYGHQRTGSGTVRLVDAEGIVRTGALTACGTADALIIWTDDARQAHGEDWLDSQAHHIVQRLANRWGTV